MHNPIYHRTLEPSADHKQGIAHSFSRAAPHYDRYAAFQRACGDHLCALIWQVKEQRLLDAGCGTGWFSRRWQVQGNRVIALDLSAAMLARARQQRSAGVYVLSDIERLPLAPGSMDGVFISNLAVQWCDSLPRTLAELYRALRPGGTLALSRLASWSLAELEQAWGRVDGGVHINGFLSETEIAEVFSPYRHSLLAEPHHLYYSCLTDLLRELRRLRTISICRCWKHPVRSDFSGV